MNIFFNYIMDLICFLDYDYYSKLSPNNFTEKQLKYLEKKKELENLILLHENDKII